MGNFFIFFILFNIIIVSGILWLLTSIGFLTNRTDFFKMRDDIFECGFRTTQITNIKFSLTALASAVFLLLYEIEFVFLIPMFFNYYLLNFNLLLLLVSFCLLLLTTFFMDIWSNKVVWVY